MRSYCQDFKRSSPFCNDTSSGAREQFNALTSFVDASNVYGSMADLTATLRYGKGI